MSESNEEIRYILNFYYKKEKNATSYKKSDIYGPNAVTIKLAQSWFKRFQSGNFDVKDAARSTDKVNMM
ncbi:unnamed protein product [Euphydryas editha]|uniref:Mos1 transposase HTH domain-containing protein n=1 Tax=Euphydryas editha TaxID=104508 RepID=A0AAU9U3W0_EUPED|nr:unnamed protein product [Euphydryas editha]